MGGKITSALSRETRDLLKENQYFYDTVLKLVDSTGLKLKPADVESKTEIEQLQDGKLAVHFLIPIDGNGDATDGRILLRDTFIFDEKQRTIHEHKRSFEYNGRGENKAEWQKWLETYKEKAGQSAQGQQLSSFAATAALSFNRPFSDKQFELFKKLNNRKIQNGDQEEDNPNYLGFYQSLVVGARDSGLTLRSRDPKSSYAVINRGLVKELVFTFALLNDDGSPGHLLVKESFILDAKTNALVGHKRNVIVPTELSGDQALSQKADSLNALEVPNLEAARAFISHFVPDILTDAPEFKVAPATVTPEAGYPEMSDASFRKTLAAMARNKKTPAMGEMDPAFFETLDKEGAYLAPLREAMGPGFALNLKDPPLKTSVQVAGNKTQIFVTYSLKPSSGEAGVLEYGERWTFENGRLSAIARQAKALAAPQGGEVETAAQRIKEAIDGNKFGDASQEQVFRAVANQAAYLAPHLSYIGLPTLLENPMAQGQLTQVQMVVLPLIEGIQADLISAFYGNDVDPQFRDDILRLNASLIHGDADNMAVILGRLQKREEAAIAAATDPEQKKRHTEQIQIADLIFTLANGDLDKAHETSKRLVSPAYKKVFDKALGFFVKAPKVMEGFGAISHLVEEQIQVGEKTGKGLLSDTPRYSSADRDSLKSLSTKALIGLDKNLKSADTLQALQAALDFGKGKQPEEMNEQDKARLLTEAERALAGKILADPLVKQLSHIAKEEDRDLQAKEYFEFARGPLFEKGLFQSSRYVLDLVVAKMPKNGATESLEILQTFAMEKSENAKVAKLKAMTLLPPEMEAAEGFLKKIKLKAQDDPTKPLETLLNELGDLNDHEKKLLDRLKKSEALKLVAVAAGRPTVAERYQAYFQVVAPYMVDQLLLDDVVAALEKDPKLSLKKVFEGIPDLRPEQKMVFEQLQKIEDGALIPQLEQKLAAAVSMDPAQRGNYYRQTLTPVMMDLVASDGAASALAFMEKLDDSTPVPAIEGAAVAEIILAGEIRKELLPQMKQAQGYNRLQIQEQNTIESLLKKAVKNAPMNPTASAYTLLNEVKESDLSPAEKEMRQQLLADKTISAILDIGAEPDIVKRRQSYLGHLQNMETGEAGTLSKAGYPQTEMWLTKEVHFQKLPDVHGYVEMPPLTQGETPGRKHLAAAGAMEHQAKMTRDVKKFMAMLEGKGDFGSKVGYGMPHFTKELFKPTSIAAMAAAPLAGGYASLRMAAWLKNFGAVGRGTAVVTGVGVEAATFTYLHAKGEKHVYGNETADQNFWKDLKTNTALFLAMRGMHLGSAAFGEKVLATGKLGKWA
ncbi:MAG TPA: hypothetical protein VJR29_01745, partial [bacterium]|nr:hypothetical protein [bacterium]